MDNIQLYYIDNEINKIDKMKQGDVIYKNGVELLVVLSYDHNEPCKGCFFYEDKACGSNCYSLAKERIQVQIKDIIDMPDGEFENLVERLFNEAKKNLL